MKKIDFESRYHIVFLLLILPAVVFFFKMIALQNSDKTKAVLETSEQYQWVRETILPDRGNIYDSQGRLLAGNTTVYEVGIDLYTIKQPETVANVLSEILDLERSFVYELATYVSPETVIVRYVVVKASASEEEVNRIAAVMADYKTRTYKNNETPLSLAGVAWKTYSQRSYPESDLASNLIGMHYFLDRTTGSGHYGLEEYYDTLLKGSVVTNANAIDPRLVGPQKEPIHGGSLILTIDRDIQAMSEKALDDAIKWSGADGGTILIYNPEDGSILSMATTPRFNLNEYWNFAKILPERRPFNSAIGQTYEPGSVFKVLTMAAALDQGTITPESTFNDLGYYYMGGINITNWDHGAYGLVDMTECMQYSLNTCLAWISDELGPDQFYNYMRSYGLDRNTGIDLAQETHWPLTVPGDSQWYEVTLGTNSYGQGISVTPIQMVMAIGAVANDGKMMLPHVVKATIIDGQQHEVDPVVVGSPIKAETAHTLTGMLVNSLQRESSAALVEGYSLAGKTGTGQIPTVFGYDEHHTNVSFVGWGPAEDPKFLIYIWLEKPAISIWASEVAAPVFSDVASKLVVLMNIPPDSVRLGTGQNQENR